MPEDKKNIVSVESLIDDGGSNIVDVNSLIDDDVKKKGIAGTPANIFASDGGQSEYRTPPTEDPIKGPVTEPVVGGQAAVPEDKENLDILGRPINIGIGAPTRKPTVGVGELDAQTFKRPRKPPTVQEYLDSVGATPEQVGLSPEFNLDKNLTKYEYDAFNAQIGISEKITKDNAPEDESSYFWGAIKNINIGTAKVFRDLNGAERLIGDVISLTGLPRSEGVFGKVADYIEKNSVEGVPDVPDNVIGEVIRQGGQLNGLFLELLAPIKPGLLKLPWVLAGSGGLNTYGELSKKNASLTDRITKTSEAFAVGFGHGAVFSMMGASGGKLNQIILNKTGSKFLGYIGNLAVNSGGFAGFTAAEQAVSGQPFDRKQIISSALLGGVLTVPQLAGIVWGNVVNRAVNTSNQTIKNIDNAKIEPNKVLERLEEIDREIEKKQTEQKIKDDFDVKIIESQEKLKLNQNPEVFIGKEADDAITKIANGEPVTNDLLKTASDQLYSEYKRLEKAKDSDTRKFTTAQIEDARRYLGETITRLEDMRQKQTETGEFVRKQIEEPDPVAELETAKTILENTLVTNAGVQMIKDNPKPVIDAIKESDLTPTEKKIATDKVNSIVAETDPAVQQAKPIEKQIEDLQGDIDLINQNPNYSDIARAEKTKPIQEKINDLTKQAEEIYNPPIPEPPQKGVETETKPTEVKATPLKPATEIKPATLKEQPPAEPVVKAEEKPEPVEEVKAEEEVGIQEGIDRVPVVGIGDLHGESPVELAKQLESSGITKEGSWNTKNTVIQMGDITDRGRHSLELIDYLNDLSKKAKDKLVRLIGNHDLFHVMGRARELRGQPDEMITAKLREAVLDGRITAAWAEGDVIYTHAGINLDFFSEFVGMSVKDIAKNLNERLAYAVKRNNFNDPIFDTENGIFWTRGGIENDQFRQVVGHTVKSKQHTYKDGDRVKYIDTGRVFGGEKRFFANTVANVGDTKADVVKEINSLPLTHVEGQGMDGGIGKGTFLSTEKGNRYATDKVPATPATVDVKNPFVIEGVDQMIVEAQKRGIKKGADTKKMRDKLIAELEKEGYDAVYFKETPTQEGELYVADRGNVTVIKPKEIGSPAYKSGESQITGRKITKKTPTGISIEGTFKVVPAADILASHNEVNFKKTENFPVNKEGNTLNDRDYENNKSDQERVVEYAQNFNEAALDNTPTITKDGIVIDGNNRVMSRKLAAKNGTDTDYVNALKERAEMYGIDPAKVSDIKDPVLIFEPTKPMPYNTETFSMFNKPTGKEKSPIARAIEISKTATDKFKRGLEGIYGDAKNASEITSQPKKIKDLIDLFIDNKVLGTNEIPRYFDAQKLQATKDGVAFLENVILGSALNETSIRALGFESMGKVREQIMSAVVPLIKNGTLGKNSLSTEVGNAVLIINEAKKSDIPLIDYVTNQKLFDKTNYSESDIAMSLALEGKGFKAILHEYNSNIGSIDMFTGTEVTKGERVDLILKSKTNESERAKIQTYLRLNEQGGQGKNESGDGQDGGGAEGGQRAGIPTSGAPKGKPIKASEIINKVEKALGIPIRIGRIRSKYAGIYKVRPEVIRLKEANDLATMSHEIAHDIDKKTGFRKLPLPEDAKKELRGLDYDQKQRRIHEGFAEFVRYYVTTEDAPSLAPKFNEYFEGTFLPANPKYAKIILDARDGLTQWRNQGSLARVLSQIDFEGKGPKSTLPLKERIGRAAAIVESKMLNRHAPINYAVNQILKQAGVSKVRPSDDPRQIIAAKAKTAGATARHFVLGGTYDVGLQQTGKSLKEALAPVAHDMKNSIAYAYAKHAISLLNRGINPGISRADAKFVLENHYKPEYEQFTKDFTEWSSRVVDYLVDAGGLTRAAADLMREVNPFYIPLKRVMETGGMSGSGGKGFVDLPSPLKTIKGSGREIKDPLKAMIAQTEQIISVADKARVARSLVDMAEKYPGMGKWIERLPPPMEKHVIELEKIAKQIEDLGGDMGDADLSSLITMFSQGKSYYGKDNIVAVIKDGKRRYYQLDPMLYDAMKGMDNITLPWFLNYTFGTASRLIRLGATGLRASFSLITNPSRDVATAGLQSRYKGGGRADKIAQSVYHEVMGKGKYIKEYRRSGVEMSQPLGPDRKMMQGLVQAALADNVQKKALV